MKPIHQFCRNCRFFSTFYTRCMACFYREKRGYCSRNKKDVATREHCEQFLRRKQPKNMPMHEHLGIVIEDIAALEKFFDAED